MINYIKTLHFIIVRIISFKDIKPPIPLLHYKGQNAKNNKNQEREIDTAA